MFCSQNKSDAAFRYSYKTDSLTNERLQMSKFEIIGGQKLHGEVKISGAKNAALKILPACILAEDSFHISNVPQIADIEKMIEILRSIGAEITINNNEIAIDTKNVNSHKPNPKLIKKLRGSIVLVGPLLAKFGKATFSQPGGCLIGARPIEDHLDLFAQLGVKIEQEGENYHLTGKPKASKVVLNKLSVTATENAIMATVLSEGTTRIQVAAAEPEIADLANFLNKMGANISGAGTHEITVKGVNELKGINYSILPDRIEAGTYLIIAIATNSEITIGPIVSDHLSLVLKKLTSAGAKFRIVEKNKKEYIVTKPSGQINSIDIDTRTYPGFPTDLQSPFTVLMTKAKGDSQIFETLFEGRFLFIEELKTMGADIEVLTPHIIQVHGPNRLKGREIISRDLRGGAALVIAGLIAKGTTTIKDIEYIDRGYEKIDQKLQGLGASIKRIN